MNVGELDWSVRLGDAGPIGSGETPLLALDDLERRLACHADELAGRLERVRALQAVAPLETRG